MTSQLENAKERLSSHNSDKTIKNFGLLSEGRSKRFIYYLAFAYPVFGIIAGATFVAYPDIFYDGKIFRLFVKENYVTILAIVTAFYISTGVYILSSRRGMASYERYRELIKGVAANNENKNVKTSRKELNIFSNEEIFKQVFEKSKRPKNIDDLSYDFISRMENEVIRLQSNAKYNLLIGVSFAFFGIFILGYPLIYIGAIDATDMDSFLISYIPRITLSFTVALLSFFFLRLYASNEYDIKHTKNEVSTFQGRLIAVKLASASSDVGVISIVVSSLANFERNFILKSGEKTISTEVDTSKNEMIELLRQVALLSREEKSKDV